MNVGANPSTEVLIAETPLVVRVILTLNQLLYVQIGELLLGSKVPDNVLMRDVAIVIIIQI